MTYREKARREARKTGRSLNIAAEQEGRGVQRAVQKNLDMIAEDLKRVSTLMNRIGIDHTAMLKGVSTEDIRKTISERTAYGIKIVSDYAKDNTNATEDDFRDGLARVVTDTKKSFESYNHGTKEDDVPEYLHELCTKLEKAVDKYERETERLGTKRESSASSSKLTMTKYKLGQMLGARNVHEQAAHASDKAEDVFDIAFSISAYKESIRSYIENCAVNYTTAKFAADARTAFAKGGQVGAVGFVESIAQNGRNWRKYEPNFTLHIYPIDRKPIISEGAKLEPAETSKKVDPLQFPEERQRNVPPDINETPKTAENTVMASKEWVYYINEYMVTCGGHLALAEFFHKHKDGRERFSKGELQMDEAIDIYSKVMRYWIRNNKLATPEENAFFDQTVKIPDKAIQFDRLHTFSAMMLHKYIQTELKSDNINFGLFHDLLSKTFYDPKYASEEEFPKGTSEQYLRLAHALLEYHRLHALNKYVPPPVAPPSSTETNPKSNNPSFRDYIKGPIYFGVDESGKIIVPQPGQN
jgi:hypothetical protein